MVGQKIQDANAVGVPLVAITTPDQPAAVDTLKAHLKDAVSLVLWDCVRGIIGLNQAGANYVNKHFPEPPNWLAFDMAMNNAMPATDVVLLILNAHRHLDSTNNVQALCNLRDAFKANGSTCVLLGPSMPLPPELASDVLLVDEDLPEHDTILGIIDRLLKDAAKQNIKIETTPELMSSAAEALTGLPAFTVEQAVALSLPLHRLDVDGLWDRKRQMINATRGLEVWHGGEQFKDIGGNANVKSFIQRIIAGPRSPNVIVFLDEGDKVFGTSSELDTSGVAQDQMRSMLAWMEDSDTPGIILYGPAGAGKSAVAKATGNEAGIPTIQFDLGGMKGSLVGESEQHIRHALKVVDSVGQKKAIVLMTCNRMTNFSPELRRRFRLGTFFFDLPSKEEREAIWPVWLGKPMYAGVDPARTFDDEGWTGAEIKQCVDTAYSLGSSLDEASKFVVPVSKSSADVITSLRQAASGVFIDASQGGIYNYMANTGTDRVRTFHIPPPDQSKPSNN